LVKPSEPSAPRVVLDTQVLFPLLLSELILAEIDEAAWATLRSDTSRAFDKAKSGRIAVKVINHLGDEVMKVFRGV